MRGTRRVPKGSSMTTVQSIDFDVFCERLPQAVEALRTLSRISEQNLDKALVELVKVRASQINGCAYCLQLHLNWARRAGVPQSTLDRLAAWREAPGFTEAERAALAWAEALTDPGRRAEIDSARQALQEMFAEEQLLRLTVAIATINAWNRIAGALGFAPPPAQLGEER